MRERQEEMHDMLDQEHRDAARSDAADDAGKARAFGRRQPGGWLVEEDEARLAGERARDLEEPPLAEGERGHIGPRELAEADELHELRGALAPARFFRARAAEHHGPERGAEARMRADEHVVDDRHSRERPVVLERAHHAARGDAMRREAEDRLAGEAHVARRGGVGAGDQVEGGALARAVGTDDAEDLAFLHLEVEIMHGGEAAEALGEPAHLEESAHRLGEPLYLSATRS